MDDAVARFGAITESEVTQQDIAAFEAKWSLPVLRIRNFQGLQGQLPQQGVSRHPNAVEVALILNIICDQVILDDKMILASALIFSN